MILTPEMIIRRIERLKGKRGVWEQHWQDVLDYTMPSKASIVSTDTPGIKKGILLFDSTQVNSAEFLAGALHGLLTNPNQQWFDLTTGIPRLDNKPNVRSYLQWLTTSMHRVLNNSNFQTEVHEIYLDLVSIGTAILTTEEDEENVIRFGTKTIKECFIRENSRGMVDEMYRVYTWRASQIINEFAKDVSGDDKAGIIKIVGKRVYKAYIEDSEEEFEIQHAVYPESAAKQKKMKFMSQYVLRIDKIELRRKGFRLFPYIVPRWTKSSGEEYGRSPAMRSLADARTLNQMRKTTIIGAQKTVDPSIQVPDEGFVVPFRTAPGSINYYRAGSNDRAEPIFNDARIDFGFQTVADMRQSIKEAFFVDKLSLLKSDRMTTVEVNQRVEEQVRLLSPMVGRQHFEFLRPLVVRLLDIMVRRDIDGDLMGNMPQELQDIKLDVQYTSTIAIAQRVSQGQNMIRAVEASAALLELSPQSLDIINVDRAIKENWRIYGAPFNVLSTEEEVEAIREGRQQAQQAALQQEQQAQQAEQLQKVGPLLKQ